MCLLFFATLGLPAADLTLTLEGPNKFYLDKPSSYKAEIANCGNETVTLVMPGDGSESGWRTPVIGWSAIPVRKKNAKHPTEPPILSIRDCGNINAAQKDEIFTLKPGETRAISGWIHFPQFKNPGKYRVVLFYKNDPTRKILGITLRPHDQEAIQEMARSTPCLLKSNEIVVDVLEQRPSPLK